MLKRSANREDIYKTNQNITLINTNEWQIIISYIKKNLYAKIYISKI